MSEVLGRSFKVLEYLANHPEGVALSGRFPYLAAGDVMEIEIDGLGRQRSTLKS